MFSKTLLAWYQQNKRNLPWRDVNNPYYTWVSEIMLQQTQVQTVIPYFNRFINALPDVQALAKVTDDELLLLWEGLGYYRRASALKASAIAIVKHHKGIIPDTYEALIKLKGIGPYTAGAILALAYHKRAIAPDGNAYRVLTRYFGIDADIRLTKTKNQLHQLYDELLIEPYQDFVQSFMDFGSILCKKRPLCEQCPLKQSCYAYQHNITDKLPTISKQKPKQEKHFYTFVLKDENNQFILTQEEGSLLKGLYTYPQVEAESLHYAMEVLEAQGISLIHTLTQRSYQHTFTHLVWHMEVVYGYAHVDGKYLKTDDLSTYPMPTAHKKIAHQRYFDSGK